MAVKGYIFFKGAGMGEVHSEKYQTRQTLKNSMKK